MVDVEREQRCYARYALSVSDLHPELTSRMSFLNASLAARRARAQRHQRPSGLHGRMILGGGFGSTGTSSLSVAVSYFGLTVWHGSNKLECRSPGSCSPPTWHFGPIAHGYALGIRSSWLASISSCDQRLDSFNYALPATLDALFDLPSAEAALDYHWANPDSLVILSTRQPLEWVHARRKLGRHIPAPVDRPCRDAVGLLKDLSDEQAAGLFVAHGKLLECVIPGNRLIKVDLFAPNGTDAIMSQLALVIRGSSSLVPELPFPRVNSHSTNKSESRNRTFLQLVGRK